VAYSSGNAIPETKLKEIFCRSERCLACKSCEIACSVAHSRAGELLRALSEEPPPRSRVRVLSIGKAGHSTLRSIAVQCRHCDDPLCVEACISGAIVKNGETGLVSIDQTKCVGCWSCIMVCPFGALIRLPESHTAVNCDRCDGRDQPACVEACPTGALLFLRLEELDSLADGPRDPS